MENLKRFAIWDLPVRLFHWSLVFLILALWITTEEALYYDMRLHQYCGYAVLTLVIFRIFWGFWGSTSARFKHFLTGPQAVLKYASQLFNPRPSYHVGHNPLGGWSVFLLLSFLLLQASTGLFANDDIFTEGPLYTLVTKATSDFLTKVHKLNFNLLLGLIFLHISAILFYRRVKKENLVKPMIVGYQQLPVGTEAKIDFVSLWRAGILLGVAVGLVYLIISLG